MIRVGTPQKHKPTNCLSYPNHEKLNPRILPTIRYLVNEVSYTLIGRVAMDDFHDKNETRAMGFTGSAAHADVSQEK